MSKDGPLKEYGKRYFKAFLKAVSHNEGIRPGDTLKMGMIFYDKNGNPSKILGITTIHKDELKDE